MRRIGDHTQATIHMEESTVIKKLLAVIGLVGLVGVLAPSPAHAQEAAVVVFTAGADVSEPFVAPGLGNSAEGADYSFSTDNPGILGANLCAGVAFQGGAHSGVQFSHPDVTTIDQGDCDLSSTGTVHSGLGGLGAFCGYSSGSGTASGKIGGASLSGVTVEWPQSAGTILPLVFGGSVTGAGAVQTTGAEPGTCGVDDVTTSFAVTGFAAIAAV